MIPIPKRMRALERDPRGYPIPISVLRGADGKPHFDVQDHEGVRDVIRKRVCSLCGKRLDDGCWFIGGQRCFTDPRGAFLDPPMHEECARFAIQTCPYLAAPRYARLIDGKRLQPNDAAALVRNGEVPEERPEVFGLGWCESFRFLPTSPVSYVLIGGPWQKIEWWRHGQRWPESET